MQAMNPLHGWHARGMQQLGAYKRPSPCVIWWCSAQKMEGARGKVNSDVILESTGPRLYSAVFKQYATQAQDPGTSVVGNFQVGTYWN